MTSKEERVEEYTLDRTLSNLGTRTIGRYARWHATLPSTNDLAMDLIKIPVPEGTVIVAEEQTAGRGRMGRTWASPRGGIWLSAILRPGLPLARVPLIGLAAAIAAARAIRETTRLLARVKWPNDVMIDGRKVVGILLETAPDAEWIVIGIGVNANIAPGALPVRTGFPATSLEAILGHPVDRGALLRALLQGLDRGYERLRSGEVPPTLSAWREMSETLGHPVRVELPDGVVDGVAEDIDDTGALLVRRGDGTLAKVFAGDVGVAEAAR